MSTYPSSSCTKYNFPSCMYHSEFGIRKSVEKSKYMAVWSVGSLWRCQGPSLSRLHTAATTDTISKCYLGAKVQVPTNLGTCHIYSFQVEEFWSWTAYILQWILLKFCKVIVIVHFAIFTLSYIYPSSFNQFIFHCISKQAQIRVHYLY